MSQRDVLAELRTARVSAPPELRERVRTIAAADNTTRHRAFTWRRSLAVLVPVAAAAAAAIVVSTRPAHQPTVQHGLALARPATAPRSLSVPAPSPKRAQKYGATLSLRVSDVSGSVQRALRIVASLGGYAVTTHVSTGKTFASAEIVVKVPRTRVQRAAMELSALGTITAESLSIQDQQTGINASERTIARLQRQLHALLAQPQTAATRRQIAQLTARVVALQRQIADTIRADRYATIRLNLATPAPAHNAHHGHGPLHGIGVAFRWAGIGLLYALAFGVPLALLIAGARWWRKRRVDALLNRP
jgi:hypothetical protein